MPRIPGTLLRKALKVPKPALVTEPVASIVEPILQPQRVTEPVVPPQVKPVGKAEAEALASAKLSDFDLSLSHMPNFDHITTTDDVKATIAQVAESNKARITEARRGTITHEQLRGLAEDLDVNQDVVRKVVERESGGVLNPETILAARQVLNSSAQRLLGLAQKVKSGTASDLDRITFRRQFEFHADYQRQFMGARAEAGRALNAFAIPVGADAGQISRLKGIVETLNGHDTDKLADMIATAETPTAVNKLTRGYATSRALNAVQELYINSILSGVKTHVVNGLGNVLFQGMHVAERGLAARIGRFLSGDEHVEIGEASAQLYGMLSGWRDGLRLAKKSFSTGMPADATAKFETQTRRAISARNLLPVNAPIGLARAVDALGTFIRIPTERVMLPIDEFFKATAQRGELARQAYLDAMTKAQASPMSSEEIADSIRTFMQEPPRESLAAAGDVSRYVTFQTPLGPAGAAFQRFVSLAPGVRLIAPFIKTPLNILKAGLFERTPLGLLLPSIQRAIREGGPQRDLALARISMGTLTAGMAAGFAASGRITGGGPQDPKARKVLEATGWQPYSIVVEHDDGRTTYQSYARAEPLAFVIGATADTVETLAYLDYDDEMQTETEHTAAITAAIVAGVANNTMSKTFMSGVADFSQMMDDPKRYAQGWLSNMAGAFIPYSAFRRDMARIQDPYIREARTMLEKLRASSGIPGFSEGAPPRRDFFGEPIRYRGGSFLGIMSPFPDTQGKQDGVVDEVSRVMQATREVPLTMPGRRVDGMLLSVDEYDELVRIGRQEATFAGNTFKDQLRELISGPVYEQATDYNKVVLIRQLQHRADEAGRALLAERNPVYAERLVSWQLKKARRRFGEAVQ